MKRDERIHSHDSFDRSFPRLSAFNLEEVNNPAETITDIWLERYEKISDNEKFPLAEDVIELALHCEDTYPFSMFENQLLCQLSENEIAALMSRLTGKTSEVANYMRLSLEIGSD